QPVHLMKSHQCILTFPRLSAMVPFPFILGVTACVLALVPGAGAGPLARTFASPEEAVQALSTAANNHDINALAAIFGPSFDDIRAPDPVQGENELKT